MKGKCARWHAFAEDAVEPYEATRAKIWQDNRTRLDGEIRGTE